MSNALEEPVAVKPSRNGRQAFIGLGFLALVMVVIAVVSSMANRNQGLRVDVLSARRAEPNESVAVTVSVRDTQGLVESVTIDFGDGVVETPAIANGPCMTPLTQDFTFSHAFDFTGFTTVKTVVVTSGCGGATEKVEAIRTLEIKAVRR